MTDFQVRRPTSTSSPAQIQESEEKPGSESFTVVEKYHEQQIRNSSPSEASSKKGEIDAEGKAQQARLQNQFQKNPVVDTARKLAGKKEFTENDLRELIKVFQNASQQERAMILNEAQRWGDDAKARLHQAHQSVLQEESREISQRSEIRKKLDETPRAIIDKIR